MNGQRHYHSIYLLDSVWEAVNKEAQKDRRSATRVVEGVLLKHYGLEDEGSSEQEEAVPERNLTPRQPKARKRSNGS